MVVSKILRQLSSELRLTETGQQELGKYREMQKTHGWKVYQGLIVTIANGAVAYLLSKDFTEQDQATKDREQRVLYMAKELFEFLQDPLKASEQSARIQQHNARMEATQGKRPAQKQQEGTTKGPTKKEK